MYNNKLAVALKSAGKVLREFGETVYVPFGSEYSVLIKNLNSVRALIKIEIDGEDIGDGTKFIIEPNRDVELERYLKNYNLTSGNRFKFIERTNAIEQHRGVGVEDGLIRIEFNFEKVLSPFPSQYDGYNNMRGIVQNHNIPYASNNIGSNVNYSADITTTGNITNDASHTLSLTNDAGLTVPGSVSDQEFTDGVWFATEAKTHVIVLQMLGQTEDNQQVIKPVTVKAKSKCTTCGRTNKATSKFCTDCGTSLTIV